MNTYYFTQFSVGQETRRGFAGWFWFGVCHEGGARAASPEGWAGAGQPLLGGPARAWLMGAAVGGRPWFRTIGLLHSLASPENDPRRARWKSQCLL